jgi:ATP-dependent protease ClpP protease subunit
LKQGNVALVAWLLVLVISVSLFTATLLDGAPKAAVRKLPPMVLAQAVVAPVAPALVTTEASAESVSVITLTKASTLSIRGPVNDASMAKASSELLEMSAKLKRDQVIYLVLDTPGGDVDAGNRFLDLALGIPQKIKTLNLFSASMGFHIAQRLDERLITPSGMMMSHRVRIGGLAGQVPGEAETRLKQIQVLTERMDRMVAARMKMSFEDYRNLIRDEYWVSGEAAVTERAADRVVVATCDETLSGDTKTMVETLFGPLEIKTPNCPLIPASVQ